MESFIIKKKDKKIEDDDTKKDAIEDTIEDTNKDEDIIEDAIEDTNKDAIEDNPKVKEYLDSLTEIEIIAYKITKKNLGSSFDIQKTNGYINEY